MGQLTEPQSIGSKVIRTADINWRGMQFLQDGDFKEWLDGGDQKLLASILKYQFIDPFKVWEHEGALYCLDGKHRCLDLQKAVDAGIEVPELLPATFIDCKDTTEAAELVLVYSSNYASITQQGLYNYLEKFNLDFPTLTDTIQLANFSNARFEQKFDQYDINNAEEPEVEVDGDVLVKPGDMFTLNGHRILCGSFQDKAAVANLIGTDKARIVTCDPPYNLPANFFTNAERHDDFAMGAGEMSDEEFCGFITEIMEASVQHTIPAAIHYIWMDFRHQWHMTEAARRVYGNPQPKQTCVWVKDLMANGSFYRAQHELCFLFSNLQARALWNKDLLDHGGFYKDENELCFIFKNGEGAKHLSHLALEHRVRTNVWRYPSATSTANPDRLELKNHPTPKPVAMIADAILDTTNEGDFVIDWFLGSGTALIACEQTSRNGIFTEIKPVFVQSSIVRYVNFCNKKGIRVNFTHVNGSLTLNDFLNGKESNRKIEN